MRRFISIALTAMIIISMFTVGAFTTTASAADASSFGTVASGYTPSGTAINTAADFYNMAETGDYYLAADIKIDEINTTVFTGTLDGNGHTVTVSMPMFENLNGATIKNLKIEGKIDFDAADIDWHCGTICQEGTDITIENVVNNANVQGYKTGKTIRSIDMASGDEVVTYDSIYSGGLCGSVYGDITLTDCANYGEIKALVAGGLVGSIKKVPKAEEDDAGEFKKLETTTKFTNCHNYESVSDDGCYDLVVDVDGVQTIKKTGLAGGLLAYGAMTYAYFTDCSNTADIMSTNTKGGRSGGLVASILELGNLYHAWVYFENCVNDGDVTGWSQIGGIAGWISCGVSAINCENNGTITSVNNYAAGIIGRPGVEYANSGYDIVFKYCVNNGEVIGHRQYAGGITSYSIERTTIENCLNTGYIHAEGVTATNDGHPSGHSVRAAGIVVSVSQTVEVKYCVNTGNIVGNNRAAGIIGAAGGSGYTGYNSAFSCLNLGDVTNCCTNHYYYTTETCSATECKTEDSLATKDSTSTQIKAGEKNVKYYSDQVAAGIMGYSYGSGNTQAPRIVGCGSVGTVTCTDYGIACGLLGYVNTAYAIVQGNFVTGEIKGPTINPDKYIWHNTKYGDILDWKLAYIVTWIDRCDAEKWLKNNYFYESAAQTCMLFQNNGAEFACDTASDCYITADMLASGEVCYKINKLAIDIYGQPAFVQELGKDLTPRCLYYDMEMKNFVVKNADGSFSNEAYESETDEPDDSTTDEPDESSSVPDESSSVPEESSSSEPVVSDTEPVSSDAVTTQDDENGGGCGGVIGASVAIVAMAILAPAGIMLKKKED